MVVYLGAAAIGFSDGREVMGYDTFLISLLLNFVLLCTHSLFTYTKEICNIG